MQFSRFIVLSALCLPYAGAADPLEGVLARMDAAAAGFKGLKAEICQSSYTAVIKDLSEESGSITIQRPKPGDLRMLVQFVRPEPKTVSYGGRKLQIYTPQNKLVQEFDLGKQAALVDQFLLLGFGAPGHDLLKAYAVKYLGEEAVDGVKASKLELTPKSQEALQHVRKLEIWVSAADAMPVQQKIYKPSRDYMLITYTKMALNPTLAADATRLKLPAGVKKEYPQK
jgi:outer membrane lipoprotein-sorting protein